MRSADAKKCRANVQQPDAERISGQQVPRKGKLVQKEAGPPESRMVVAEIKAALLVLHVPAGALAQERAGDIAR